ncbi:MAG: phosphotriesterase family protein [Terriglobia bacterium]
MPIMTARGPLPASEAGYTLSHEHVLSDLWKMLRTYDAILDDEELAIQELASYKVSGGSTLVDLTCGGMGRNPEALRRISEATGVHIILGAGWYRQEVYPHAIYEKDTNSLASIVIEELTAGIDGADVRAGVIGEIGTGRGGITPAEERVFRACARAQRETGAAIVTHTTHFGELAREQIALLREEGVLPDRMMISHLGDRIDPRPLLAIAREGVYLSVDNIGYRGHGYPDDTVRAVNICCLIAEGHLDQLLLGGDVCMKSHLAAYGGKGYAHVQLRFLPMLRSRGVSEEAIYQITVANPARLLDVPESPRALTSPEDWLTQRRA